MYLAWTSIVLICFRKSNNFDSHRVREMEGVVRDVGENAHSCGYCKSEDSFYSHGCYGFLTPVLEGLLIGMVCSRMTVQAYQELLHIGWRRSGCYLYKAQFPASLDFTFVCV